MCSALAEMSGLFALIMCMPAGAFYENSINMVEKIIITDGWTYLIFLLFLAVSRVSLDIQGLPKIGILDVVYLLVRFLEKWIGLCMGALLT